MTNRWKVLIPVLMASVLFVSGAWATGKTESPSTAAGPIHLTITGGYDTSIDSLTGERPTLEQALEDTRGHLHYVHLKNMIGLRGAPGRFVCGLGEGEINNRHFLRLLRDEGYDGPLALEGPRPGDRERYAPQDLAYGLELLKDLRMS